MRTAILSKPLASFGHAERALLWLALAAVLIGLRAAFHGLVMSPTVGVLVGAGDDDPLGPLPANRIALEDPLLLVAAAVALAFAVRHALCLLRRRG